MKRAIVLSGGGAKGAYQLGVWKALRQMHKKVDLVTGTSIGALNGCLMVQKDFDKANKLWHNLSFSNVYDKEFDLSTLSGKADMFKEYISAFVTNGGMDVSNLEKTVADAIDVNRFYASDIDFGLVTFQLNTLKPILLTKKDIKRDLLDDYLIASATCYPAFKKKEIGQDVYIDGGYYDNLPINLAIDMGATEVIAVDLNVAGLNRKIKKNNIKIKYIKPRNKIINFLEFEATAARRSIRLGYNDTMKEYDKLDGDKFTFKKYHLTINYFLKQHKFKQQVNYLMHSKSKIGNFLAKTLYEVLLEKPNGYQILMNDTIEYLGYALEIEDSHIYGFYEFNRKIKQEFDKVQSISKSMLEENIAKGNFKRIVNVKTLIRYIYDKMKNDELKEIAMLAQMFPKVFVAAAYLYIINKE